MNRDDQIIDLLMQFEDAIEAGVPVTPQDLCRSRPDLLPDLLAELAKVRAADAALRCADDPTDDGPEGLAVDLDSDRYRPLSFEDAGGQGAVFTAEDGEVGRTVALKLIRDPAARDDVARARFLLPAEVTGRLEHPGVVPVYGLGHDRKRWPFYAMRFVRGANLRDEILRHHAGGGDSDARRASLRRLLRAVVAACETVAYAHARGMVHRDLKPANIMLGRYGETLVLDWGLAKRIGVPEPAPGDSLPETPAVAGRPIPSLAGVAKGTWAYMPPEQARGDTDAVGPASDVFGLGATLYAVLTGQAPYDGPDARVRARAGEFDPPRRVRRDVPRALDAVCRKAMAASSADRCATAKELDADVQRWLDGDPVTAWPEPLPVRAGRWARGHRTLLAAVAVAVSAAAAVVVAGKNTELVTANHNLGEALLANHAELYAASVGLAHRDWQAGDLASVRTRLDACPPERRGWEWRYLDRLTRTHLRERTVPASSGIWPVGAALDQDGRRVVVLDTGRARAWELSDGRELAVPSDPCSGPTLAVSADGSLLAVRGGSGEADGLLRVWDLDTGKPVWESHVGDAGEAAFGGDRLAVQTPATGTVNVFEDRTGKVLASVAIPTQGDTGAVRLALSPDGRMLAVAGWEESVGVWEVVSGKQIATLKGHAKAITFSPDGKYLGTGDADARIWEVATGQLICRLDGHAGHVSGIAGSADGRVVATASWDQMARIWDARTGRELRRYRGHTGIILAVTFDPVGNLVTVGADGSVKTWDATTDQDARILAVPPAAGGVSTLAVSPDGSRVAGVSRVRNESITRVWEADTGRDKLTISVAGDETGVLTLSRDGKLLAARCGSLLNWTVRAWDVETGREVFTIRAEDGPILSLAFTPDGRHLAGVDTATARVWELASGELAAETGGGAFTWITTEPGSDRLLLADWYGRVRPWDWHHAEMLPALGGAGTVWLPSRQPWAVSADGAFLAGIDSFTGRDVAVVDTARIGAIEEPRLSVRHARKVTGIDFSPDGRRLVTGGMDGMVRVWDARTSRELLALRGRDPFVGPVAFSADGRLLVAATHAITPGAPNHVVIWSADAPAP
jgi:WD40 repeat protein/tRNA A-37 threonylcarbamoyl transferase component Bud32